MEEHCSRSIDEAMLVGSGSYDSLDALREHPRVVLVGLECVMVTIFNNILSWSRWSIHRDGICTVIEL